MENTEENKIADKKKFFEEKYKMSFFEFEAKIKCMTQENFYAWDDYMEWKAYLHKENLLIKNNSN